VLWARYFFLTLVAPFRMSDRGVLTFNITRDILNSNSNACAFDFRRAALSNMYDYIYSIDYVSSHDNLSGYQ